MTRLTRRQDGISALVLAAVILGIGLASAIGFIERTPRPAVASQIAKQAKVGADDLLAWVAVEGTTLTPAPTARTVSDIASAQMIAGLLAGSHTQEGARLIDDADLRLTEALTRAPANAFAWSRLAQLALLKGDVDRAKRALEASFETADFEPTLTAQRLRLAFAVHDAWDDPFRGAVLRQAGRLTPEESPEFIALARLYGEPADDFAGGER